MEFSYSSRGININIRYSQKDYTAEYTSPYGILKYGRHIMAMCPWMYSEEIIRENCESIVDYFIELKTFLDNHPDFIENAKKEQKEYLAPLELELTELRQKKSKMRKLFKNGEIPEKEYGEVCKQIKKKQKDIWIGEWTFFNELQEKNKIILSGIEEMLRL